MIRAQTPWGVEGVEHWGWVGAARPDHASEEAADAWRYLVATKGRELRLRKLSGV